MRQALLIFVSGIIASCASAQQNVGIGTNTPSPNAKLEIVDTARGILMTSNLLFAK